MPILPSSVLRNDGVITNEQLYSLVVYNSALFFDSYNQK